LRGETVQMVSTGLVVPDPHMASECNEGVHNHPQHRRIKEEGNHTVDEDQAAQSVRGDIDVAHGVGQADGKRNIDKVQVIGQVGPRKGQTSTHSSGKRLTLFIEVIIIEAGILLAKGGMQEKPGQHAGQQT